MTHTVRATTILAAPKSPLVKNRKVERPRTQCRNTWRNWILGVTAGRRSRQPSARAFSIICIHRQHIMWYGNAVDNL